MKQSLKRSLSLPITHCFHLLKSMQCNRYYKQASTAIKRLLARSLSLRSIGVVRPGGYFLARFQNRFVWVQITEVGFDYCRVALKVHSHSCILIFACLFVLFLIR